MKHLFVLSLLVLCLCSCPAQCEESVTASVQVDGHSSKASNFFCMLGHRLHLFMHGATTDAHPRTIKTKTTLTVATTRTVVSKPSSSRVVCP